ncbi:uncharacterized protein LOC144107083 [Amblyomma americanum]
MLEKEFCTTPTVHEYEFSHHRHRQGATNEDVGPSTELRRGPQTVDLPAMDGGTTGLLRPAHETQDRRLRSHQSTSPTREEAPRRHRRDAEGVLGLGAFVATGPAGRISPPGMVVDPYYIGDSVTQISPTSFSFSRRRQVMSSTPVSEADLTGLTRKSSSTTTFSEDDFHISYHKVPESSAASWLEDGEEEDHENDLHDRGVGRRYRRRDADRVPSVELPSVRTTHKTMSEQLTSRGTSALEDVSIARPRSEDLSVHMREPAPATLSSLEAAMVRSAMLRRIYRPSRTGSDIAVCKRRDGMASRVGFGSSPGFPLKTALKTLSDERTKKTPHSSPPPPHHGPPPTPPPPTPPPRVPAEKLLPAGGSQQAVASTSRERGSPAETKEAGCPIEKPKPASPPRPVLQIKESRTSRTPSQPQSPTSPRTSSFLQARIVQNEQRRGTGRKSPSTPRSIAAASKVSEDDDDMIAAAEYALSIVGAPTPAVQQGREPVHQHDKAVQVHIRTLDKRLVVCTILAGALAIALVAVVLFALLDK